MDKTEQRFQDAINKFEQVAKEVFVAGYMARDEATEHDECPAYTRVNKALSYLNGKRSIGQFVDINRVRAILEGNE